MQILCALNTQAAPDAVRFICLRPEIYRHILSFIPDPEVGSCVTLKHKFFIDSKNHQIRAQARSVVVKIGRNPPWLDPDEEHGWDQPSNNAIELLEVRAQSLIKTLRLK